MVAPRHLTQVRYYESHMYTTSTCQGPLSTLASKGQSLRRLTEFLLRLLRSVYHGTILNFMLAHQGLGLGYGLLDASP